MTEYKLWGADSEINLPASRKLVEMMKGSNTPIEFEVEFLDEATGFSSVDIVPARYSWTYEPRPKGRKKFSRKIEHNIARREARIQKKLAKKFAKSFQRHLELVMVHGEKQK